MSKLYVDNVLKTQGLSLFSVRATSCKEGHTLLFSTLIIILFIAFTGLISGCSEVSDHEEKEEDIEEEEIEEVDDCISGQLYLEKDGVLRVDLKNPNPIDNDWKLEKTFQGYEGHGYLIWKGDDHFNTPGEGVLSYSIQITNPGTYQFVWRSRIGAGTKNTEHNDSWLRISNTSDFYGEKESTGERVYPVGSGKSPSPEGSSKDGWLKVYMNRLNEWFWRSTTNDKDPFNVFVEFDVSGIYVIEISGRSAYHAIDQFVLFETGQLIDQATTAAYSEIRCN